MNQITDIINQINDNQTTIASAVEEQSAAVREVARNAIDAAKASERVSGNINSLSEGIQANADGAKQAAISAQDLTSIAQGLKRTADSANLG